MPAAEPLPAQSSETEVGELIDGRYRVESPIGRGGAAAVYRVRDEQSGRVLALKRLVVARGQRRAPLTSLFEREFHTLVQLAHPRIIRVYDYGVDAKGAYYTMELLAGADLRSLGKRPWPEACALLRDVASSLAILHSRRLLHRDVSARNVVRTEDGRAKLIDFGALAPMGPCSGVVGTPPFIAPEALAQQALDGRADLFALGALGYFVLTERHAYPARSIADLQMVWRRALPPPHEIDPEIPEALSRLVMELLHLDRMARPSTAADIIERLCTLAGVPVDELPEVRQAYLATPMLVGRAYELARVRDALHRLERGRAVKLLVEGEGGAGRSRMLDACVLEAKLLGATVLRADASDGSRAEYGVVQALAAQLLQAQPELARAEAQRWTGTLEVLVEELGQPADKTATRRQLQDAASEWLLAVARRVAVVIAVDDFEQIDDASAAVIAALAHGAKRHRLALLLASDSGAATAVLALVRTLSRRVPLAPLTAAHIEQLLRSVFGDVDGVVMLAQAIHERSQGSPRASMTLAQHVVDNGLARYQAGAWVLPHRLLPDDLPPSVSAALITRITALSPDARALAEALSLTDPTSLSLDDCCALGAHGDRGRAFRAVDELLSAGILATAGEGYSFAQPDLPKLIGSGLDDVRRRATHARLAGLPEAPRQPFRTAHHLMEAGEEPRAIELMLERRRKEAGVDSSNMDLDLLERAAAAADRLRLGWDTRLELAIWIVGIASTRGDYARFRRHAFSTLERLEQDSGLADWRALEGSGLDDGARLTAALARVQRRFDASVAPDRGLSPIESIRQLARLCATFASMAAIASDPALIERVPSLTPLSALSPALSAIEQLVQGLGEYVRGRQGAARETLIALVERLEQADRAGVDMVYHNAMRLGVRHLIGMLEVLRGLPTALTWVEPLAEEPGFRANVWRLRRLHHMMLGAKDEADECQRRAELAELQDGSLQRYPGSIARGEIYTQWLAEDRVGLKRSSQLVADEAERLPRIALRAVVARSHYRRLQGDPQGALDCLSEALQTWTADSHCDWPWLAAAHVHALHALRRDGEAAEFGLRYCEECRRHGIDPGRRSLYWPVIEALLGVGRVEEARRMADELVAGGETDDVRGLIMGLSYEARARVALAMGDDAGFQDCATRCAREYRRGKNPALSAKYERLMRDAEQTGLGPSPELHEAARFTTTAVTSSLTDFHTLTTVRSQLRRGSTLAERAQAALAVLIEASGAARGYIAAKRGGRLRVIAALPVAPPPPELEAELQAYIASMLAVDEVTAPVTMTPVDDGASLPSSLEMLPFSATRGGRTAIIALGALAYGEQRRRVRGELLAILAAAFNEEPELESLVD